MGKRPVARFKRGYKWTYLYAFVHPESGEVYWLILPTVNVELFSIALREFAREVGAGKDKRVLLVVDQAGWHTGGEGEVPEGIHLEFLPSGSPELQPVERLWTLTNEAVANGLFEEIEQIEEALMERCLELLDQTETISALTNYHWWPQAAGSSKNSSAGFGITPPIRRTFNGEVCARGHRNCPGHPSRRTAGHHWGW